MTYIKSRTLEVQGVPLTLTEAGKPAARPALVLHGGAGPESVAPLAAHLAANHRVLAPTHPGWDGTPRPESLTGVGALASLYLELLAQSNLRDVVLVGSSFGGWVASRLALDDADSRVGALVLLDAIGPEIPGLAPRVPSPAAPGTGVPQSPVGVPAAGPSPAALATLRAYTGTTLTDPGLLPALADVSVPTLLIWGEHDRVVSPAFGRAYADAFRHARFELIPGAGHIPMREAPDAVFTAIIAWLSGYGTDPLPLLSESAA